MFRERITQHYQSLSASFKKVADFVLASHQRVAFMSASRLAKQLGVDVATVTRFSQRIGYKGYTELIREIQEQVLEQVRQAHIPITERLEAAEDPFVETLWQDWANLEKTIQNLPREQVQQAIASIQSARRIYVASEGVGGGVALAIAAYLRVLKPDVTVLREGPLDTAIALKEMGPEDVIIGIGFTNYDYASTRALERGRKVGAKTIGVIAQPDCPIGAVADILLVCSATEEGYQPSFTSVGAILFGLANSLALHDPEGYKREARRIQDTCADLMKSAIKHDKGEAEELVRSF